MGGGGVGYEGVNIRILWAIILGGKLLFRLSAGRGTVRSCKVVLLCWVLNSSSGRNSSPQLSSPHSAALLSEQLLDSNHSGIRTCRQGSMRSPICLCVCISCLFFLRALLKSSFVMAHSQQTGPHTMCARSVKLCPSILVIFVHICAAHYVQAVWKK